LERLTKMIASNIYIANIEFNRIEAEFYQPKFLKAKKQSGDKLLVEYGVKVIHPAEVKRIYSEEGTLKIVLAQNVRDNVMDWTIIKKMDSSKLPLISRNLLIKEDVLVTRSGANFGQTSVITIEPEKEDLFACADVLILKPGKIGGPLLSTFLNTRVGKLLMTRGVYGAGQPHVAPSYISRIPFPEYLLGLRSRIEELLYKSRKQQEISEFLYTSATILLEEELGLDKIQFIRQKTYTTSFSEVINNNRSDADYYQTKYRQLEEHLYSLKTVSLGSICSIIKGYEVGSAAYLDSGPLFIRVSNLNKDEFSLGNSDKYISLNTYNSLKQFQPKIGNILLTKDGTPGICYVVNEEIQGIISSGLLNLSLIDTHIPKEYLALVINSKICQMQVLRDCSGALILHWKPIDVHKLKIPILKDKKMEKLADLASKSKEARKESKTLLAQAKAEVESFIENASKNPL